MFILGINTGLGASVCLLNNGKIKFAIEEERLTKKKNFGGFPYSALNYLKKYFYNELLNTNYICICDHQNITVTIDEMVNRFKNRFTKDTDKNKLFAPKKIIKNLLPKKIVNFLSNKQVENDLVLKTKECLSFLNFQKIKFLRLNHHMCHASSVYFGLAKDLNKKYLIFTLDGGGDGESGTINIGHKGKIKKVFSIPSKNSIAALYSSVTYLLGFKPHEHEYKIMGLAPYTSSLYSNEIKKIFLEFLDLSKNNGLNFLNKNITNNHPGYELFEKLKLKRFDNIAYAIQTFTEELTIEWIKRGIKKFKINDILLSGGLFMNIKINKLVSEIDSVNSVDVFPSCGDETNSLGISFHCNSSLNKRKLSILKDFNLGPSIEIIKKNIPKENFKKFSFDNKGSKKYKLLARLLSKGHVVGNLEGKMEFGARALGNRSLLADPINSDVIEQINYLIKKRDFWMPFAPAILKEDVSKYIKVPKSIKNSSPYMMFGFDSIPSQQKKMIAGLHRVDKTARAQIVDKTRYPNFHKILTEFKKITGRSVLLNTSFNLHGDPLAMDSYDAFKVMNNSQLKYLFINDTLVTRR